MDSMDIATHQIMLELQAGDPKAARDAFNEFVGDMDRLEVMFHLMTNCGPARALQELEVLHSRAWERVASNELNTRIAEE